MNAAVREFVEAVLLALLVFIVIQVSVQNFRVEGSSMEPTLTDKEYLLVNKLVYLRADLRRLSSLIPFWQVERPDERFIVHPPRRGDVIVFRYPLDPQRDFVKRVIGMPGDTVELRRGVVYVNGVALDEPYVTAPSADTMSARKMGEDEYFVLGDNRRASNDSRDWGPVPLKDIIGKVWIIYWPTSKMSIMSSPASLLGALLK